MAGEKPRAQPKGVIQEMQETARQLLALAESEQDPDKRDKYMGRALETQERQSRFLSESFDLLRGSLNAARTRMFSLATGALALSVTFRGSLVTDDSEWLLLLRVAWVSLGASSIGLALVDQFQAYQGGAYLGGKQQARKWMLRGGKVSNWMGTGGFIVGIVCLLAFGLANL
jgi:hypothetical protein